MLVYTQDRKLRYTWMFNAGAGFTAEQVIGKTDEELGNPEEVRELVALKRSVLATGVGVRQELELPHAGVSYWFDVTIEPTRDERGSVTGLTVAAVDITEKKRREHKEWQDQVRIELQRRLLEEREQERLTLARDLHDGAIQTLAATIMDLEMLRRDVSDPWLDGELGRIDRHIRDANQELRDTVSELRPSLLHTQGLAEAMRVYASDFRKKYPEVDLKQDLGEGDGRLSRYTSVSLFRIYQEALQNVVRHSNATQATVRLAFTEDAAILEVRDNGAGMPHAPDLIALTTRGHYGLAGMKERAEAVNGQFRFVSAPGQGTEVRVTVPACGD